MVSLRPWLRFSRALGRHVFPVDGSAARGVGTGAEAGAQAAGGTLLYVSGGEAGWGEPQSNDPIGQLKSHLKELANHMAETAEGVGIDDRSRIRAGKALP